MQVPTSTKWETEKLVIPIDKQHHIIKKSPIHSDSGRSGGMHSTTYISIIDILEV